MMKYLPIILVVAIIGFIIYLDYRNRHGRQPRWMKTDLPGGRKAVTMPPFGIYIEPDVVNAPEVTKHEMCHWKQYTDKGLVKFYADYFKLNRQYDYNENPMETECFQQ